MEKIIIYGVGGLGKEVLWLLKDINRLTPSGRYDIIGMADNYHSELYGTNIHGVTVLGDIDVIKKAKGYVACVCAIGDPLVRKKIVTQLQDAGVQMATVIHPTAQVFSTENIGTGSIICAHAVVSVDVTIGRSNIINFGSMIGHDCRTGDYCTINSNSVISGNVHIGEGCEFAPGSFIYQGKSVVNHSKIGPNSTVYDNITRPGTYIGNPARCYFKHNGENQ